MRYQGHNEAATKQNTMGGSRRAEHKTVLPSNPGHPSHQYWLQRQQGQGGRGGQGGQGTYQQVPAMAAAAMQPNQLQMQQQFQPTPQTSYVPMQQGFMAPGGVMQPGTAQPSTNYGMHMQHANQKMPANFNQGTIAGNLMGTNFFGPVF